MRYIFLLVLLLLGVSVLTLCWGPNNLHFLGTGSPHWNPVFDQRLPRLIILITTGASLAASGAVMQSLFQNPLAAPSVLGISFGGSLLVVIVSALDLHFYSPYAIPSAAFIGSLATLFLVYSLSRTPEGCSPTTLILSGIAISTVFLACQSALLYALKDRWQLILALTEWEAGSTHNLSWKQVHMQLPLACVGLFGAFWYRRALTLLTLGDEEASLMGVEVSKVRFRLMLSVSLLTGGALAAVGIIAFFGLILPHIMRSLVGSGHPAFLFLSTLGGATMLPLLDILLRVCEIHSFTIGNVSAILGGVFFLLLLYQSRQRGAYARL